MLNKLLEALYTKVLVNIVVKHSATDVYIEICSKKGVLSSARETFPSIVLDDNIVEFINTYTKESPYFYISLLDYSKRQGAIPTCSKKSIPQYIYISDAQYKCADSWTYYTSKSELYGMQSVYREIGLDFIFSPFTLLSHFFEDKIDSNIAMYLLIKDSYITLSIFENSALLFAEYLDLETLLSPDEELKSQGIDEDISMLDESINLEDIDVIDDMEDFEDFGDIEDLDSLEEIDEFSENKDMEEELSEVSEAESESDESSFNEDYQHFVLVQTSLGHFYKDERFASKFIENVYIADSVGVSKDLKYFLEEEMYLNVYIRSVNLGMEVAALTKRELKL